MKKIILFFLALILLAGCSKTVKYRINAYHNNLPAPDGKGSIVYGYLISDFPLKEVIIVKMDDGRRFRADFVPSTVYKWNSRNYFYISNVPKGRYGIHKIVAATMQDNYMSTTYRFQYCTFRKGTKYQFNVPGDGSKYLGRIALLKRKAYQDVRHRFPLSTLSKEKSDQQKLLLAFLKKSDASFKKGHAIVVSQLEKRSTGPAWIKRIVKTFPGYKKTIKKVQAQFLKRNSDSNDNDISGSGRRGEQKVADFIKTDVIYDRRSGTRLTKSITISRVQAELILKRFGEYVPPGEVNRGLAVAFLVSALKDGKRISIFGKGDASIAISYVPVFGKKISITVKSSGHKKMYTAVLKTENRVKIVKVFP